VIVAQLVQAPESQVERDAVESSFLAAKLVIEALEVMRQLIDRHEPHDDGRALDAVEEPEGFLQGSGVSGALLKAQQRVVEPGNVLVGLVEIEGHQFGGIEARHRLLQFRERIEHDFSGHGSMACTPTSDLGSRSCRLGFSLTSG